MNNGLPSNLYNGGAVVFNSQPSTQFYLNSMAKKRAKDEALDNYYKDYLSKINPDGLRPQDTEGWYSQFGQLKDYYMKNAQAIKNPALDNGKAYNQYLGIAKGLESYAQQSKGLGQISTQYVAPIITDPNKKSRLRENGMSAIHAHDLPINDPNHQQLDPSTIDYSAKPFDIAAQKKLDDLAMKGVKMSNTVAGITVDPKTKNKITSYHAEYSPEDLKTIGGKYADAYHADDSFANAVDEIIHGTPESLEKYNQVFKGVYGHDIESNEDVAAAYGLSRVQSQLNTQKGTNYNPYTPYDSEAIAKRLYDYKKEGDQDNTNNTIDELVEGQKQASMNPWNSAGVGHIIPTDRATLVALHAEKIRYEPNGNLFIPEWTEDGNLVQGTPMTEDSYKAFLGKKNIGAKYFQKKGSESQSQPKTETKSSSSSSSSKKTRPPLDSYIKSK